MLKCQEVSQLIASGQAEELSFRKRLELRFHLLMCRHCHNYARQIKALGVGARQLVSRHEPTSDELQQLEDDICDKICAHGPGHSH